MLLLDFYYISKGLWRTTISTLSPTTFLFLIWRLRLHQPVCREVDSSLFDITIPRKLIISSTTFEEQSVYKFLIILKTNPSLCKLILASVLWRNQEFLIVIFELKSALCIIISREAILKYFILLCCIDEGVLQYCMCSFAKIPPPYYKKTKRTHSDLLRILVNKFKIKIVWLMRLLCSVNFHFETVFSFKLTHLDWKHIASWCCFAISKHKNHISWVSSSQWLDCIILLKFHQIPLKRMISLQWPGSIVEFKVDL